MIGPNSGAWLTHLGQGFSGVTFHVRNDSERTILALGGPSSEMRRLVGAALNRENTSLIDQVHPSDLARLRSRLEEAAQTRSHYRVTYRSRQGPGNYQGVLEIGRPVAENGETGVTGFEGVLITFPEPFSTDGRQLESTASVVNRVAHDFNNILSVVLSNLDLLMRRTDPDDPHYRWCQRALAAAQRGADYTEDLLSFARRQEPVLTRVDVNRVINRVTELEREGFSARGVNLSLELDANCGPVEANEEELVQSLRNLVENALEATLRDGLVKIRTSNLRSSPTEASGCGDKGLVEYVMIEVVDTGEGMSPEALDACIQPFWSTRQAEKKLGLGLPKTLGSVARMKGTLELTSKLGVGTRAVLSFPRSQEH